MDPNAQPYTNNVSAFTSDHYVRSSWIAFFTLWVIWGLSYFLRHAFKHEDNVIHHDATGTATHVNDPEVGGTTTTVPKKKFGGYHTSMADRFRRSHEVLFENTLLLLSVLTLNTFGAGATRSVMILSWIFVAVTIIHTITEAAVKHNFIRFGFNLVFYGVTLAIGGLAFYHGWR